MQSTCIKSTSCNKTDNASRSKVQYPLGMVLINIKAGNFEKFYIAFQWEDRRLVGITVGLMQFL